jgi:hypothetical protein
MSSVSFLVKLATFATSSISSAFVMATPFEGPTLIPGRRDHRRSGPIHGSDRTTAGET